MIEYNIHNIHIYHSSKQQQKQLKVIAGPVKFFPGYGNRKNPNSQSNKRILEN